MKDRLSEPRHELIRSNTTYRVVTQKLNILNVVSHKPSFRSVQSVIFYSPVSSSNRETNKTKPNIFTILSKQHAPKRVENSISEQIF